METSNKYKDYLYKVAIVFFIVLTVHVAVGIFKGFDNDGRKSDQLNTITLSGHGEVTAVPDIANISFTITKDAKTAKDAQAGVATVEKNALDVLKAKNIDDKDIKTADASFYPKYEYKQAICPQIPMGAGTAGVTVSPMSPYYCPPSKQVISGYTSSESITVKVRNTDDVGAIMQGLGTVGVSNLSGPNFSIDNQDGLKAQARKKAIDDAKMKAEVLAKDLGVHLGKISSFNESGNYPIMYDKAVMMSAGMAPAPAQLPKGENLISSDVTITYEIR